MSQYHLNSQQSSSSISSPPSSPPTNHRALSVSQQSPFAPLAHSLPPRSVFPNSRRGRSLTPHGTFPIQRRGRYVGDSEMAAANNSNLASGSNSSGSQRTLLASRNHNSTHHGGHFVHASPVRRGFLRRGGAHHHYGHTVHGHHGTPSPKTSNASLHRGHSVSDLDLEKMLVVMEKGCKVCKLSLSKKWDPSYKRLAFNPQTRQIVLSKYTESTVPLIFNPLGRCGIGGKQLALDLRLVKRAQVLDYKLNTVKIVDKWKKDPTVSGLNPQFILVVYFGSAFVLNQWILYFDSKETCHTWAVGIQLACDELRNASHHLAVERWLRKQFCSLVNPETATVTIKQMKPFVQVRLQCKVSTKQLQELTDLNSGDGMGFEAFVVAHNRLLNFRQLFTTLDLEQWADSSGRRVPFTNFLKFLQLYGDDLGRDREGASDFLRHYLRDVDPTRDVLEPHLTVEEFADYLFSPGNSLFDPMNKEVVQDMSRPLTHYWIASSHNTYLTGDQFKSESSLDAYARALLLGCRCIELDCWDGQRRSCGEYTEIVIYHGYTMTTKLNLRDVLHTIKHYAFLTSDYPVILSIEDNCSVPAQRLMAQEIREILGDLLLTQPVSKDEWCLPSPAALRRKIILKHKKLQLESEGISLTKTGSGSLDDDAENDILHRECTKRGVLYLRDNTTSEWRRHLFVLFTDRLCYILKPVEEDEVVGDDGMGQSDGSATKSDGDNFSLAPGMRGGETEDEGIGDESGSLSGFGVRPEEMHLTEEWFHGKLGRDAAKARLMEHEEKGNGLFLVRESSTFVGDFTLSFYHSLAVHHCRIRTTSVNGEKKFYFLETHKKDSLYELISYYTRHSLDTPAFRVFLSTPCPQPQPHLDQPWFCAQADKRRAEELLDTVQQDGAFLIRYSTSDHNVYVLSLRVDNEVWHYRLKRDGRIFVVNQTIFENLNQLVEYYATRDFVPGIFLRFPVNERTVGQYVNSGGDEYNTPAGWYMELKDLEKEIDAIALKEHIAQDYSQLSFPQGAKLSVLRREDHAWKGRYQGVVGWFLPECVELSGGEQASDQASATLQYATIDLAGSIFERSTVADKEHCFRISSAGLQAHWNGEDFYVAAESREELDHWLQTMHSLTRTVNDKINLLRTKEKQLRIANELSALVVYCQAVPFNADFALQDPRSTFYEMCSFSESKHDKLLERGLPQFNSRQLSRVYPQASRLSSSNFNPVPMWNSGCHMVALNYQTGDRAMQLNYGKFLSNGRCGFVLKPDYLMDETFRASEALPAPTANEENGGSGTQSSQALGPVGNFPINLVVQVLAGRHLSRREARNKGICSPMVDVEIAGLPCDSRIQRTTSRTNNGLNPVWQETFVFNIRWPEMALLRFHVEDGDFVGPKADPFIGQATFPVDCIRNGYRSVPLLNQYSEPLELSALLVYVEIRSLADSPLQNPHLHLQASRLALMAPSNGEGSDGALTWDRDHRSYSMASPPSTRTTSILTTLSHGDMEERKFSSPSKGSREQRLVSQLHSSTQDASRSDSVDSIDSVPALPAPQRKSGGTLRRIFRFGGAGGSVQQKSGGQKD